jgi:Uma2 family endonuclease
MAAPAIDTRRFTREEYESLVEQGFFGPEERLELLEGIICPMSPHNSPHAACIAVLQQELHPLFATGHHLRVQLPLALSPDSEPEPELAVIPGSARNYFQAHPASAVLVIEVSDSTLLRDRSKQKLYAEAGIPDSWILNLVDGCLEVYRDPNPGLGVYRTQFVLRAGERISPLARPEASVAVSDLLP